MKLIIPVLLMCNILLVGCSPSEDMSHLMDVVYLPTHYEQTSDICDPTHVDPQIGLWSRNGAQHIVDKSLTVFDPEVIFADETTTMYRTFSQGSQDITKSIAVMDPAKFNNIVIISLITVIFVFVTVHAFVGFSALATLLFVTTAASISGVILIIFGHSNLVIETHLEPGLVTNSPENPAFYTNRAKFYDTGKNGDVERGDGVYTKTCIKSIYDFDSYDNSLTIYDDLSLRVLNPNLRGQLPIQFISESIAMTEYGIFVALGPDYMDVYKDSWLISGPENCIGCHTAFELVGDQFDFFVITPRTGAPDYAYYIRVHDGVGGIGIPEEWTSHDYVFPDRAKHQRLQGMIYINDSMNWDPLNHELGHWVGLGPQTLDYPSSEIAWNFPDGSHLHSNSTAESLLSEPVWNTNKYSYVTGTGKEEPVLINDMKENISFARLGGNPEEGFYLEPRDPQNVVYDDIFLYMMGLLPANEVNKTYWQVKNIQLSEETKCSFDNRKFFQEICDGPQIPVLVDEAIAFDIDSFIEKFGNRINNGTAITDTFSIGFVHVSPRPFNEAEIIFRSFAIRDWTRTDDVSKTEVINNYTWQHVTQGTGKIRTNFIDDLRQDVAEYEKWLNYTYNSGKLIRKE